MIVYRLILAKLGKYRVRCLSVCPENSVVWTPSLPHLFRRGIREIDVRLTPAVFAKVRKKFSQVILTKLGNSAQLLGGAMNVSFLPQTNIASISQGFFWGEG